MKVYPLLPSQALDLAYRRQKVTRAALDAFEAARCQLLPELAAKAAAASADTLALEQQLDALVAALYGLTPEEQALLTA